MKLASLFRKKQPPRRVELPWRGELGWGGAAMTGGAVTEEHHPDLKGREAVRVATRMRRTDAQVRAVEKVIGLPIRATAWLVEEPPAAGPSEREAAERLRENLFGGMETPWDEVVREGCLAIYYGWRVPEIIWEERDGFAWIRRIAGRNPERVERWLFHPDGRLAGYVYAGTRAAGRGLETEAPSAGEYARVAVPIEKTLHFVYDGEGGSPEGFGLWRSMHPHWKMVQATYTILGIGIERNLLGVPVGKLQEGAQADEKEALLRQLRRMRAAEDGAFVLPQGQQVEWFETRRNVMDAMPFIHHHKSMMAMAALAQFLNLGQAQVGTQALALEHARLFMEAEEANARWIEETVNARLVRPWVRLNYGAGLRPPAVRHRKVHSRDLVAWTAALNALVAGGLIHPGPDDEAFLRDAFELPAAPTGGRRTRPSPGAAGDGTAWESS